MTVCYVNEQLSVNKLASNDFDEGPVGQEKWEKFYTSAVPHPCFYLALFTLLQTMSCCIVQGLGTLLSSTLTWRRRWLLCRTRCLWVKHYTCTAASVLSAATELCVTTVWCVCMCFFFHPIQDRSRAAKYQVSPDMKHVLFAFEVRPVGNSLLYYLAPHHRIFPDFVLLWLRCCLFPQIYQHSYVAKYIIYSLTTQ